MKQSVKILEELDALKELRTKTEYRLLEYKKQLLEKKIEMMERQLIKFYLFERDYQQMIPEPNPKLLRFIINHINLENEL